MLVLVALGAATVVSGAMDFRPKHFLRNASLQSAHDSDFHTPYHPHLLPSNATVPVGPSSFMELQVKYLPSKKVVDAWCAGPQPPQDKIRALMNELMMPAYYQSLPADTQCFFVKKQFMKALAKQGGDPCSACVSYVCPMTACPGDDQMSPHPPGFANKCANCRPLFCPNKDCMQAITLSKFAPPMKRRPVLDALPKQNAADLRLLKVACNTKLEFWGKPESFLEDLQLMSTMFMIPGTGDKSALCQRLCKVASGRIGKSTCEAIHQLDIPREKASGSGSEVIARPTPVNLPYICNQALPGFDDPKMYKDEIMNIAKMLEVPVVPFNKKIMCRRIADMIKGKPMVELYEQGPAYQQYRPHCAELDQMEAMLKGLNPACIVEELHLKLNALGARGSVGECPICKGSSLVFNGEISSRIMFGSIVLPLRKTEDMCKLASAMYEAAYTVHSEQEREAASTTLAKQHESCMPTSKLVDVQTKMVAMFPKLAEEKASLIKAGKTTDAAAPADEVDEKF